MNKKILGITIISAIFLALIINTLVLVSQNENLKIENQDILENGSPLLKENIEALNEENISLKKELEYSDDKAGEKAMNIASEFLENFYKRKNTQPIDIYRSVEHLITEEVLHDIGCSDTDDTEMVYYTNYGDSLIEQKVLNENSFYKKIDNNTFQVLSYVEVMIGIDREYDSTKYLYEFEITIQEDESFIISEIVRDTPLWEIG